MFLGEKMNDEMIRTTAGLIAGEPSEIRFIREEMTRTPAGGIVRSDPVLLDPQTFFFSGIVPDSTLAVRDEGEIVRADHVLVGMPGANIRAKDYFAYLERGFEVIQVIEATQDFETRAWVKEVSPQTLPVVVEPDPEPTPEPFSYSFDTGPAPLDGVDGWEAGPEFVYENGSLLVAEDSVLAAAVHEVDPALNRFTLIGLFNVAEQGLPLTEDVPSLMTAAGVARYADVSHKIIFACMSYFDIDGNSGVERIGEEFNITTSTSFQVFVFSDSGTSSPIDITVDGLVIHDGDQMTMTLALNYETGEVSLTYQGHEETGTIDPEILASLTGTKAGMASFRMEAGRQWSVPINYFSAGSV